MGIVSFIKGLFTGAKPGANGVSKNGAGDRQLLCVECKKPFTFEEGEQKFFQVRGLTPPKRCSTCRNKKRHHRRGRR